MKVFFCSTLGLSVLIAIAAAAGCGSSDSSGPGPSPAQGGAGGEAGSSGGAAGGGSAGTAGGGGSAGANPGVDPFADTLCTDSFCWAYPKPQGNSLRGLAVSPNAVWAVGGGGTLLRKRDNSWKVATTPGQANLNAVWAAADDNVWAVGDQGTIIHWDGKTLSSPVSGVKTSLYGIWGTAPDDLWAVGAEGTILHWDGKQWASVKGGQDELHAVWGSGSKDVWAVGGTLNIGTFVHWDGSQWTSTSSGMSGAGLYAITGKGPKDVWAAGEYGHVYHFGDNGWQFVGKAEYDPHLRGIALLGSDVWVAGGLSVYRYKDDYFPEVPGTKAGWEGYALLPQSGGGSLWLAGQSGGLSAVSDQGRKEELPAGDLAKVYVASDTAATGISRGTGLDDDLRLWTGNKWENVGKVPYTTELGGTADGHLLVVGLEDAGSTKYKVQVIEGTSLKDVSNTSSSTVTSLSVPPFGAALNDLWLCGGVDLLHYDGSKWSSVQIPEIDSNDAPALKAVAVRAADDIWMAGASHYDGAASAYVAHYDGKAWSAQKLPNTSGLALSSVAYLGSDLYVAGVLTDYSKPKEEGYTYYPEEPMLYRLSGASWTKVTIPDVTPQYHGTHEVRMAAGGSTLWYATVDPHPGLKNMITYDGTNWTPKPHPAQSVAGLFATPSSVWIHTLEGGLLKSR